MTCVGLETLAAWTLGEIATADGAAVEEHVFACDTCAARAERLESMVRQLRSSLPPWLTRARRAKLEAERPAMPEVPVSPGGHGTIELARSEPIGLWIFRADLTGVKRLDCELATPDGQVLNAFADVPFDAERGELVLACQIHYRDLPYPEDLMVVRAVAVEASGRRPVAEYRLTHVFRDD